MNKSSYNKKKKILFKMTRPKNNVLMVKRFKPKEVRLADGRVSMPRYKRVKENDLPANIKIRRTYRQNPVQGRQARITPVKGRRIRGRRKTMRGKEAILVIYLNLQKSSKKSFAKTNGKIYIKRNSKSLQ